MPRDGSSFRSTEGRSSASWAPRVSARRRLGSPLPRQGSATLCSDSKLPPQPPSQCEALGREFYRFSVGGLYDAPWHFEGA